MNINSELLEDEDFQGVKESLIKVSEVDGQEKFRVRVLEYINDTSSENDQEFFYDMMEFIRFLDPSDDAIAYTTPESLIFLNCPKDNIKNVRQWDFTYDHECLHQLWDTFGVGKKIQEELGNNKYDHTLLNLASDCVINDWLSYSLRKEMPEGLITPTWIKEKFGIDYDRKKDTQYTLYLKMLEVKDKIQQSDEYKNEQQNQQNGKGSGNGQSNQSGQSKEGGESGEGGEGQQNSDGSQPVDNGDKKDDKTAEDAQNSADEAKKAAEDAQKAADEAKEKANKAGTGKEGDEAKKDAEDAQKAADEAKEAAGDAQKAADKAKKAKKDGDKEGEEKAAKEAADAAKRANEAAYKSQGKEKSDGKDKSSSKDSNRQDKSNDSKNRNGKSGSNNGENEGGAPGKGHIDSVDTDEDLASIREKAKAVIEKYRKKISGEFGKFISKCKASVELKNSGLEIHTQKGQLGWNQKMNSYINAFVKKKVFNAKREFERTYKKRHRRDGFVKWGEPIMKGKRLKDEKLTINVAFYIDRSGSMSGCINQVFKAAYVIAESLKKQYGKEKVVDSITFRMFAFDDDMQEVKYGQKCSTGGGTMNFEEILENINEKTKEFLVNVIITDAGFAIDQQEVEKFMKTIKGMLLFITNVDSEEMKALAKKYDTQLFYVLADSNFEIQ